MLTLRSGLFSLHKDKIRHGVWMRGTQNTVTSDTFQLPLERLEEDHLPMEHVLLKQVHEDGLHIITPNWQGERPPQGDGLITQLPGVLLAVKTADCLPLLLFDPVSRTIAALHLGWRSAFKNLLPKALEVMKNAGAFLTHTLAFIGPCIHRYNYEIDHAFMERFIEHHPHSAEHFFITENAIAFDIAGFVASQLQQAGVYNIDNCNLDTYSNPGLCYSHRRGTHAGEPENLRHVSYIYLSQ